MELKVAIIGAGMAGLAGARRCQEYGFQCDVFEMTEQIGGIWVYTDEIGLDKYGYPIHTAMYKGLRTILPKESMEIPGFRYREQNISFITQADTLEYLNSFADYFNIRPLIKLNTIVTEVRPAENDTWQVTYRHKPTKEEVTKTYDAVMLCNGHFSTPHVPKLEGEKYFKGNVLHSYHYRSPDAYKDKRVLVVGAGPSGIDITVHLMDTAKYVVLSHHLPRLLPAKILQKPDVKRIGEKGEVIFVDDTSDNFDTILFCTGYFYNYPFLHETCGITVENNHVQPLYKHLINIARPTMALVGVPFQVAPVPLSDIQVRYFCQLLRGSFHLPNKEAMKDHMQWDLKRRWDIGWSKKRAHEMGFNYEYEYILDLAKEAGLEPIPSVVYKIGARTKELILKDWLTFKDHNFRVIDDETFEEIL